MYGIFFGTDEVLTYQECVSHNVSSESGILVGHDRHGTEEAIHEEWWDANEEKEIVQKIDWMWIDIQMSNFDVHLEKHKIYLSYNGKFPKERVRLKIVFWQLLL